MTFRGKVTLLGILCILYVFLYILPQLHASSSREDTASWRWQHDVYLPTPYRSPPSEKEDTTTSSITLQKEQVSPDEKFITFFTHSGFQNQLIQGIYIGMRNSVRKVLTLSLFVKTVENGILLAWYLNRTLILPRALLGEAFGWSYFGKLHLEHMLRDPPDEMMPATDPCEFHAEELAFWDIECPDPNRYTTMPFDEIFDLSWAKQHVKIVLRERSDFEWLEKKFGIRRAGVPEQANGSYVDGDILFFKGILIHPPPFMCPPRKLNSTTHQERRGMTGASLTHRVNRIDSANTQTAWISINFAKGRKS